MKPAHDTTNGSAAMVGEEALADRKKKKHYKNAGWRIARTGDKVVAENLRHRYDVTVGNVYTVRAEAKAGDAEPKVLADACCVAGKWRAVTKPVTESGRERVMDLTTFLVRYVDPTPRADERKKEEAKSSSQQQLIRIEKKLDLLLTSLGVVFEDAAP